MEKFFLVKVSQQNTCSFLHLHIVPVNLPQTDMLWLLKWTKIAIRHLPWKAVSEERQYHSVEGKGIEGFEVLC